jgi:hypothetical protein
VNASREDKYATFSGHAGGELTDEQLAAWIRQHLVAVCTAAKSCS